MNKRNNPFYTLFYFTALILMILFTIKYYTENKDVLMLVIQSLASLFLIIVGVNSSLKRKKKDVN